MISDQKMSICCKNKRMKKLARKQMRKRRKLSAQNSEANRRHGSLREMKNFQKLSPRRRAKVDVDSSFTIRNWID